MGHNFVNRSLRLTFAPIDSAASNNVARIYT
jgi:hypothetical protein